MSLTSKALVVLLFTVIFCGGCGGYISAVYSSQENITGVVDKRERVNTGSSGNYLVWVVRDDGVKETLKVDDSILYGKFASSDTYGTLIEGKKFNFHVSGWRIPFFSMYRNILEAKEVPSQ